MTVLYLIVILRLERLNMYNKELIDAKRYIELALCTLESKRVISKEVKLVMEKLIECEMWLDRNLRGIYE